MNNIFEKKPPEDYQEIVGYFSWTAYITPLIYNIVIAIVLHFISVYLLIIPILLLTHAFFITKSGVLFLDNDGVWFYQGVFPWNSGTTGVKWRDLDEALMRLGFFSWALKSYTVEINHRYTKDQEFKLSHIKDGDKAVFRINEIHKKFFDKIDS